VSTFDDLIKLLADGRSRSTSQVLEGLRIQPHTLSRALKGAPPRILRFGETRRTRYALTREVSGTRGAELFRVGADGTPRAAGRAHFLAGEGTLIAWSDKRFTEHPSIPWFIDDMRPQGFLGRAFVRAHPELALASNPLDWRVDAIWNVLLQHADDLMGDLLIGAQALERHARRRLVASTRRDYDALADRASEGGLPASSAGGEHQKFTALVNDAHVIVKFSPPLATEPGQRWADLLICEHLALESLKDAGISAAQSAIVMTHQRTHLEVQRFDRVGVRGRRAIASLRAIDMEHNPTSARDWAAATAALAERNLLDHKDADTAALLEAFGRLIANSDRHFGNLSFFWNDDGRFTLAPVYDMLPMAFAPTSHGTLDEVKQLETYDARTLAAWPKARELAASYWRRVLEDSRISKRFKERCAASVLRQLTHV
jgi:hypothetical protein